MEQVQAESARAERRNPRQMPWVIPANCEGCGDCVNRCSRKGLKMAETNVKGVFVPWLDHPELCSGCGKCAAGCVMGAIQMTEFVDMAMERFLTKRPTIAED
ncbi:MAG: ATP-binding protein [Thermoleophilia bacterium]